MGAPVLDEPLDVAPLGARYLAAQLGGDRRSALRVVVDALAAGVSPLVIHEVVRDAQREIGRLWQEDRITIAQEHMATAISQIVLSHVYQHAEVPASNGVKVVVACAEGELHDMPARLVADALDLAGFEVRYLGASVPTTSLVAAVRRETPALVVLSVTLSLNVPSLMEAVPLVRAEAPAVKIAVGGAACAWGKGIAEAVGADIVADDATTLVTRAREAFGVVR